MKRLFPVVVLLAAVLAITNARHFAGLGAPVVIIGSMGGNAHERTNGAT